jgi:hypothetical protein
MTGLPANYDSFGAVMTQSFRTNQLDIESLYLALLDEERRLKNPATKTANAFNITSDQKLSPKCKHCAKNKRKSIKHKESDC